MTNVVTEDTAYRYILQNIFINMPKMGCISDDICGSHGKRENRVHTLYRKLPVACGA
jgi:hypothetical protein